MDEARSMQYSIDIKANVDKAGQDIQNLISQCGTLRAESSGTIDIEADTDQALENIRELAGGIGKFQSDAGTRVVIDTDTEQAEANVRELTEGIGSIRTDTVRVAVDTDQAQTDVKDLAEIVTNFGHDPPDIRIDVDTGEAERSIGEMGESIKQAGEHTKDFSNAASSLRKTIGSQESELRKLKESYVDLVLSEQASSQETEALAEQIGKLGSELQDNRAHLKNAEDAANRLVNSLNDMGDAASGAEDAASILRQTISQQESDLQRLKQSYVNLALSEQTSSQEATNLAAQIGSLSSELQGNKTRLKNAEDSADQLSGTLKDIGDAAAGSEPDVESLGDEAEKSGGKFEKLGGILKGIGKAAAAGLTAATTSVGVFAASSINAGMTFDSSMSQIASTMGYTVDELNDSTSEASQNFSQLREFAMEMGANTAFSASESADALNYMALAGYDAEKSMAMLPNVLNLAAAGGIELASASDMVTDAQSALGLTMDETSELVDKIARTSSKSNTSVAQLGEAILTVGGTAKTLSGGTTELSMALGVLADNGVKGAEGGTALRNMILSLSAPTEKAAAQLKALGVEAFDSEGNLRPLNETFGDLNGALSSMTQEQQTQALSEVFNKVDLKSVNAMLGTSAERFNELTGSIEDSKGAAADMADTQLDNLAGDITLFKSALEGAQIIISDELSPSLREFTQFGTDSVTKLSEAFQEGGLDGAMSALGDILSDGLGMIIEMLPTAIDAGMQLLGALGQGLLDNMPLIIDAAIQIVTMLGDGILRSLPVLAGAAMQVIASLASGIGDMLPDLIPSIVETVIFIAGALIENLPIILDAGMQLLSGLADGIVGAIPILIEQLPDLIISIVDFITGNLPEIVETGINLIVQLGVGLIQAIPQLVAQLPQIISAIVGGLAELPGMVLDIGINIVKGIWSGISQMGSWIKEKVSGFFGGVVDGVKGLLGIHSPSTVFAGIGDNMAQGLGQGFGKTMEGVTKDIEESIPTNFGLPDIDRPDPNSLIGGVADELYHVSPIIDDVNPPAVPDITYGVKPQPEEYNPTGITDIKGPGNRDGSNDSDPDTPEDMPPPQPGSPPPPTPEGGGGFSFPPVNIYITVEGSMDEPAAENLKTKLHDTVKELFEEFRNEEIEHMALKEQYAF